MSKRFIQGGIWCGMGMTWHRWAGVTNDVLHVLDSAGVALLLDILFGVHFTKPRPPPVVRDGST